MNLRFSDRALAPLTLCAALTAGLAVAIVGCGDPNPRVIKIGGSGGILGASSGGILGTSSGGHVGSGGTGTGGTVAPGSGGVTAAGGAGDAAGGTSPGAGGSGDQTAAGGTTGAAGAAAGGHVGAGGGTGAGGATDTGGSSGGQNLITNGDFSMGDMFWSVDNSSVSHAVTNGQFCVMLSGSSPSAHVGWPATSSQALNLAAGTYRLSYQASSTGPLNVTVQPKVGMAVDPYTADYPTGNAVTDPVTATLQTFTHTFTTTAVDAQAGLAFTVGPNGTSGMTTLCFDNVSLSKQ